MASDSGGPGVLSASERDRQYCELCGKMENLLRCGRCRSSFYCCKEHQRQDWKKHKLVCQGGEAPRAQPAPAQPRVAPPLYKNMNSKSSSTRTKPSNGCRKTGRSLSCFLRCTLPLSLVVGI